MVGGAGPGRGWPSSDWRDCPGWNTSGARTRQPLRAATPAPSPPRRTRPPAAPTSPPALRGQSCRWGDGGTSRSSEAESGEGGRDGTP
ncbi:hypothetical protein CNQ36_15610 [Streptomyces fungicidicus]|uniref:Uncharacterized protein n=1 Tax=Streptomyces fungicidicus TaxID=68203 RepID=A0A494V3C1_9ACTN|nr:hypothetical protein CNQ36_15610 [Streptomyces fungicidicus]